MAHIRAAIPIGRPAVHQSRIVERQYVTGLRPEAHRSGVDQLHEPGQCPVPAVHIARGARESTVALWHTVIDAMH